MSFPRYLKEHPAWTGGCFFLIVTMDIFLLTVRGSVYLMLYMSVATLGVFALGMIVDYLRLKKMFDEINLRMDQLDKKYLIPEVIKKEGIQERELLWEILKGASFSMEENISSYRRNLEEYKEYIETWVHEVKIPIATSKMMMENYKGVPLEKCGIDEEIDRIEAYVEQALYYSRSAAVENDYFIKEIGLGKAVRTAVYRHKKSFISAHASIDIEESLDDVNVRTDEKWLIFILGQILGNSLKYSKDDEPLKISIHTETEDDRLCLCIRDNGIGMKSSEQGRAFEKGFTGTNGRKKGASTGIGLYLCRKLCRRLEHDIRLESEEGKGTVVYIVF